MRRAFLLFAAIALCGCDSVTGIGDRVGTITKVTQKGFLNQTWEVEIVPGGKPGMAEDMAADPLCVTVRDRDLLPLVHQYFSSRQEVHVRYTDASLAPWSPGNNGSDAKGCAYLLGIEPHFPGNLAQNQK